MVQRVVISGVVKAKVKDVDGGSSVFILSGGFSEWLSDRIGKFGYCKAHPLR